MASVSLIARGEKNTLHPAPGCGIVSILTCDFPTIGQSAFLLFHLEARDYNFNVFFFFVCVITRGGS